jgi:hypothetical protein
VKPEVTKARIKGIIAIAAVRRPEVLRTMSAAMTLSMTLIKEDPAPMAMTHSAQTRAGIRTDSLA